MSAMQQVTIYTDGSCEPNPGPGGWAAILTLDSTGQARELSGPIAHCSNNVAEMTAVLEGLKALKEPCRVRIVSDSQYVVRTLNREYRVGANAALWEDVFSAAARHTVAAEWVRGHSGHPLNERANTLAYQAMRRGVGNSRYFELKQMLNARLDGRKGS